MNQESVVNEETLEAIKADYKKVFKRGIALVLILSLLFLVLLAMPVGTDNPIPGSGRIHMAKADIQGLGIAMKFFHDEFHEWPDARQVFAQIQGKNIRQIPFYEQPDTRRLGSHGTPLDPWGYPYIFDGIVNDHPRFHSIGKDGIDQHGAEGSDDIVSWR